MAEPIPGAGGDGDAGVEWDEEEEELLRNIGEHSLLSRVQKQLYDQLSRKKYR